jgi:hypothetical protein
MKVRYTYADRKNYKNKGISKCWIDTCELHNYVFDVALSRDQYWILHLDTKKSKMGTRTITIHKKRCIEIWDEITLPRELFEICITIFFYFLFRHTIL